MHVLMALRSTGLVATNTAVSSGRPAAFAAPTLPAGDSTRFSAIAAGTVPARTLALAPLKAPSPALLADAPTPPSLAIAIERMTAIETDLIRHGDKRAVFVTTYLQILKATQEAIDIPGYFADPACVEQEALRFVQYYVDNHEAYDRGDRTHVTEAWLRSFDRATSGKDLAIEDLILGINAHVNYDLPRALAVVGAHTPAQRRDFEKFNTLLFSKIEPIKRAVIDQYTAPQGRHHLRVLTVADHLLGQLDEKATKLLFRVWRNRAWKRSTELQAGNTAALGEMAEAAARPALAVKLLGLVNPLHGYLSAHQVV